ncbi:MAG: hydrolase TatD [Clostridia bacterium]|nr:MAG: hydrolase TatD [Clostridia bacterium]
MRPAQGAAVYKRRILRRNDDGAYAMRFFDTHAHLNDESFDTDRAALIEGLPSCGAELILDVACAAEDFEKTLEITAKYPFIYGAYGIHPHYASDPGENWEARLRRALCDKKAACLGEIGLDYHYDLSEKEDQKKLFDYQLKLAKELGFPVSLHIREAFGDAMEILRANKDGLRGVMHCFSGSVETARECLDLGLYIALGGAVTFKNAVKPIEVAKYVPADRLLLETDCPYMTPVPHRGKRNDPSFVPIIAQCIADARGEDADALAKNCLENGKRLFGIS